MSDNGPFNLIITGVGGQGNVLISQILGRALIRKGRGVVVGETFGLSQRGGGVSSHVRIFDQGVVGPIIPEGRAHAVLGIEPMETLRVLPTYGRPDIKVIVNSRPVPPLNVLAGEAEYPSEKKIRSALGELAEKVWWVNATKEAQKLGAAIMANIVLLGSLIASGLVPLSGEDIETTLAETLPENRLEMNIAAFRRGMKLLKN